MHVLQNFRVFLGPVSPTWTAGRSLSHLLAVAAVYSYRQAGVCAVPRPLLLLLLLLLVMRWVCAVMTDEW